MYNVYYTIFFCSSVLLHCSFSLTSNISCVILSPSVHHALSSATERIQNSKMNIFFQREKPARKKSETKPYLSVCLSIHPSIYLSVCLPACLPACLSVNIYKQHDCQWIAAGVQGPIIFKVPRGRSSTILSPATYLSLYKG